jgi:hypothetical protein
MTDSDRERLKAAQAEMEAKYEAAKAELMRIPGVVGVGIGLRERDGGLTREPAWRVYVQGKKPLGDVPASERIPPFVQGIPTDVLTWTPREPLIGFNDEEDTTNYNPKVGGSQIGRKGRNSVGTLACFVRTADNKVAALTNYHVLWEESDSPSDGIGIGQPAHSDSICCTCNEFATTLKPPAGNGYGNKNKMDCALAILKEGVSYSPRVKTLRRADNTVEQDGTINGTAAATMGDAVWKIGRTTGLTRGTISQTAPEIIATPNAGLGRMVNFGDSGSALFEQASGNIVGLIWGMNGADNHGIAIPIADVLSNLNVTVITTAAGDGMVAGTVMEAHVLAAPSPGETIARIVDRLSLRPGGAELAETLRQQQREIAQLVNAKRGVTLAWQRNAGPTWMAAVLRSAREPTYRIPAELNGIPRAQLGEQLINALALEGSEQLQQAVTKYGEALLWLWNSCDTVDGMIETWGDQPSRVAAE